MASDVMKRLKPLLDAGLDLAQMTPAKAEAIVRELVKQGEVRRHEAAALAQVLVDRGREATAKVADLVRVEVTKQLDVLIGQVEMLEQRVSDLSSRVKARATGTAAKSATPAGDASASGAAAQTPAQKSPAKKAAASKTAAKKSPAKKAAPQKTAAQKSPAKKSVTKKPAAQKTAAKPSAD